MRVDDATVPPPVEDYLVNLYAGATGGGAVAGRRMHTVVEDRFGVVGGHVADAMGRLAAVHPAVRPLPAETSLQRFAVPIGRTGLAHIVIDLAFGTPADAGSSFQLRAYGKEGILNRRPTARLADEIESALTG